MSLWNNIKDMNPFSKYFIRSKEHSDITREHFEDNNAQGVSVQEFETLTQMSQGGFSGSGGYDQQYIDFNPEIEFKKNRVQTYREMALSPEVDDGVINIVNDATQQNENGLIFELDFKKRSDKEVPGIIKQRIRNAYEYLYYEVINFNSVAQEWWKRFLVDGELYIEWILNDKGTNIIGYQMLPCFTMAPIWAERGTRIKGYIQLLKDLVNYNAQYAFGEVREDALLFQSNQISYIAYPGPRGNNRIDVRGYLETSIRIWNLLRAVEDAVVVYRLVRAPERRVWNIYTGGMPPQKAAAYISRLQREYKKKLTYDSGTGKIDQQQNVQSILEDFWFPKDASGVASTVETMASGMNLGEITDLDYLQKKLYKSLKLPTSRWAEPSGAYTGGKIGEVTREEVRFAQFVNNLREVFKTIIREPLFLLLKMRGIDEKYISPGIIDIIPTKSNYFEEYLSNDLTATKLGIFQTIADKIWDADANPTGIFHKVFALNKLCGFSQTFIDENQKMINDELKLKQKPVETNPTTNDEGEVPVEELPVEEEQLPDTANSDKVEKDAMAEPEATSDGMGMQSGNAEDFIPEPTGEEESV
jgi:hypothetical protein